FCGEGGGLLVAGIDQPNALAATAVVDGEQVPTGEGEDGVDAAGLESTGDQPPRVHGLTGGGVDAHAGSLTALVRYFRRQDLFELPFRLPQAARRPRHGR